MSQREIEVMIDDLLTDLEQRDHYSLPFEVKPRGRGSKNVDAMALADLVWRASGVASARTEGRPDGEPPTWCDSPDVMAGRVVVAEILKGPMDERTIRQWFADFANAFASLESDAGVTSAAVLPYRDRGKVPDLAGWPQLAPTPTAFLYFSAPDAEIWKRRTPSDAIAAMAEPIVDWSRLPGGTQLVYKGQRVQATTRAAAVRELRAPLPESAPSVRVEQVTLHPRRLRLAHFGYPAKGVLQVFDEDEPPDVRLATLLEGLVKIAPYLQYAAVRPGLVTGPSEDDVFMVYRRMPGPIERLMERNALHDLLDKQVPEAYVAQVVTSGVLERMASLDRITTQDLGGHRHLVVARDREPWWSREEPTAVQQQARRDFGDALIPPEVIAERAAPPPHPLKAFRN